MWKHIVNKHGGRLPIEIKAAPQGLAIPVSNVMMTVENTDPACAPLTNHWETFLSKMWFPCTVATVGLYARNIMRRYLEETAEPEALQNHLPFMLHDFGYRGTSSEESAMIGGAAHLINFFGTDTIAGITGLYDYYKADQMPAFSVPASEHSIMTAKGPAGEFEVVQHLLKTFPEGIVSVVSDSYDIFGACRAYGTRFKRQILDRKGKFVVRPDSGDPIAVTLNCLEILKDGFGVTINSKGYKQLPPQIGIIWGDGIELDGIERVLAALKLNQWSASNIVFGMGGGLLQKIDRDTQRFAFKASAIEVNGVWSDVFKNPIHSSKGSKRGKVTLVQERDGRLISVRREEIRKDQTEVLRTVFKDGEILVHESLSEIRKRASEQVV
jgi:nicotinamide phosphoribosyltransferase